MSAASSSRSAATLLACVAVVPFSRRRIPAPQVLISDLAQRGPVHHISVSLVGQRSNRDGLGAIVTVRAGGRAQRQVNDGKSGYLAQSVMPLYFGLGAATQADSITVKWPTGKEQVVAGPHRSGAKIVVREQ